MKIYCVEDDDSIRELIVYTLNRSEHSVEGFAAAGPFWQALQAGTLPDLVLLDIMLPGEDGIAVLKKLRAQGRTREIPVIMLTAKNAEVDKVMGLDAGADDYITKPFGMTELLSRIRAVGRRTMRAPASTFSVGPITMDVRAHRVCVAGKAVALTLKEYNLLALLLAGAGTVLTRDALLTKIWGYDFDGETRTVDVHVRTLRQKLGDAGKMIETVRGVGYRIGKGTEAIGEGSEQR